MTAKTFEIRDRATFMPMLAVRLDTSNEADRYLIDRAGFGRDSANHSTYVMLTRLIDEETHWDPFHWGERVQIAHLHIRDNFDSLATGEVIDIEFLLGETKSVKMSERHIA